MTECEGHESTSGPIGNVIYCDGSCIVPDEDDDDDREVDLNHQFEQDEDPTTGFLYEAFWR